MLNKLMLQNHFAWGLITPGKDFNWQSVVKHTRVLRGLLIRVAFLAVGRITPTWVTLFYTFGKQIKRICKSQGLPGLVRYCKVAYVTTQQSAGGYRVQDITSLGCRISRTTSGLPRIINKVHRRQIRNGNTAVLRMYLTMFGLYRVIEIPGKVKLHTITGLCLYRQADWMNHCEFIPEFFRLLTLRVTGITLTPGEYSYKRVAHLLGYKDERTPDPTMRIDRLLPITSAGPLSSCSPFLSFVDPLFLKKTEKITARQNSCTDGDGFLVGLWRGLRPSEILAKKRLDKAWKGITPSSIGNLWFYMSHWMNHVCLKDLKAWAVKFDIKVIKTLFKTVYVVPFGQLEPWGTSLPPETLSRGLGKLAFLEEAAGKVRVVALVDPVTQSLLYPLHKWLFSILSRIPEDGTFDQVAPLETLISKGHKDLISYDLSAATDRLPLALQEAILGGVLGEDTARTWASLLVNRDYTFSAATAKKYNLNTTCVKYAAGQPMGAYSSWAMLALTHHFCVQLAARRAGVIQSGWFECYAVLGDDVVIANNAVASAYLKLMREELRVEIQETKSLISSDGTCEFAKRTIFRGNDATPISLKGFMAGLRNLPAMEGILAKLPGVRDHCVPSVARALGYGYKAVGRLNNALQRRDRLQGLIVFLTRPGGLLARDYLPWVTQEAWNMVGCPITNQSLNNIYRKVGDWAGDKALRAFKSRKDLFARISGGGGWLPTNLFPTRTLFDVYQNLVLRPISQDLEDRIAQLDVLLMQWRARTDVREEDFNIFMKELDEILTEVNSLPRTPKVARLETAKPTTGSQTLALWRSLRSLVIRD